MTRLLIDECVNRKVVLPPFLSLGACLFVAATKGGRPDPEVMALAIAENAILLTKDSDFGRLIFGEGLTPPPGVILVTMTGLVPNERAACVHKYAAQAMAQAQGALVVVEAAGLRRKPFAPSVAIQKFAR